MGWHTCYFAWPSLYPVVYKCNIFKIHIRLQFGICIIRLTICRHKFENGSHLVIWWSNFLAFICFYTFYCCYYFGGVKMRISTENKPISFGRSGYKGEVNTERIYLQSTFVRLYVNIIKSTTPQWLTPTITTATVTLITTQC